MAHIQIDDTLAMEIGKAGAFTINVADMPEAARQYVFKYGLRQCLADAHSAAKSDDERKAMTWKKLDALMRGEFRVASGRTSDPILAEAKRMAKAAIEAAAKVKGVEVPKGKMVEMVTALAPKYMDRARETLGLGASLDLEALGFDAE